MLILCDAECLFVSVLVFQERFYNVCLTQEPFFVLVGQRKSLYVKERARQEPLLYVMVIQV